MEDGPVGKLQSVASSSDIISHNVEGIWFFRPIESERKRKMRLCERERDRPKEKLT